MHPTLFAILMVALMGSAHANTAKISPAKCPGTSVLAYICTSTPKAGDHELVIQAFDSIAICERSRSTLMAVKKGHEQIVHPAKKDLRRAGSAIYSLTAKDMQFQLSITTGILATKQIPAKLSLYYQAVDMEASSTYSCDKAR